MVGVRAYSVTTGVWTRGIFVNEYGLDSSKVTWVVDDEEHVTSLKLPGNVVFAPQGRSLADMMATGEITAGFTGAAGLGRAGPPTGAWERGGQKHAEVYPEIIPNAAQVEADWFKRTGIYPIHGSVVVKTDVLERASTRGQIADGCVHRCEVHLYGLVERRTCWYRRR
jgi:4,5-dihydroxyphthalate decarboxylase